MKDHGYRVLFYKGRGFISAAIRWQTWGPYSHVALLCPNGVVLEAWQFVGVHETHLSGMEGIDAYDIPSFTLKQWQDMERFMRGEIGCKYDYLGVARFVFRQDASNHRWFCSEILAAAGANQGVEFLGRTKPHRISPSGLSYSPHFTPRPLPWHLSYLLSLQP